MAEWVSEPSGREKRNPISRADDQTAKRDESKKERERDLSLAGERERMRMLKESDAPEEGSWK